MAGVPTSGKLSQFGSATNFLGQYGIEVGEVPQAFVGFNESTLPEDLGVLSRSRLKSEPVTILAGIPQLQHPVKA